MRMWNIDPSLMCRKHLLGEHSEMHMFVGTLRDGKSIEGFIRDGLVDTADIKKRHDQLADELTARGMKHLSPMDVNPEYRVAVSVAVDHNQRELARRCPDCRARLEAAYGPAKFSDIPLGGDKVFRNEFGDWHYQLNGVPSEKGFQKRDTAVLNLERARRTMRKEGAFK